jgi:hypothetical protein
MNMKTATSAPNGNHCNGALLLALTQSPHLRDWMCLFHRATGLAIRLESPDLQLLPDAACVHEYRFCGDAGVKGSSVCDRTRRALHAKLQTDLAPQQVVCDTGFTEVAVPLVVKGRHVATFMVGQSFAKKPSAASWDRLLTTIPTDVNRKKVTALRQAYFSGAVVPEETLELLVKMVSLHAQRLAGHIQPAKKPARKKRATSVR